MIWDQYCHPMLRGWDSEFMSEQDMTPDARAGLLREFDKYICPAGFWKPIERMGLIWNFKRRPRLRRMYRSIYQRIFPLTQSFFRKDQPRRFIEKTASNCFRLGYVNEVFPDARIIYPLRDGRNNVNSLINGWLHPERFFTYEVPETLHIRGYAYNIWKFVLPPGWREYVDRSLAEVCAFQWRACHEYMLSETKKPKYRGRVLRIKLEQLAAEPEYTLRKLADFVDVPYGDYFQSLAARLPVINSPDNDTSREKWRRQNPEMIEKILPQITPMMHQLDYEL